MRTKSRQSLLGLLLFSFTFNLSQAWALDAAQFRAGLCPGNPLKGALAALRPVPLAEPAYARRQRDRLVAMNAAKAIYSLGDLELNQTGRDLLDAVENFIRQKPAGYDFFQLRSETSTGLKYVILKPIEPLRPWILAIAGTQTALDWVADLDLGRGQFQRLQSETRLLTTCENADENGRPLADHEWIIVGHSLGGGLAEAFAYEVQRLRREADLEPLLMQVVTFNAFGAKPLIEKFRSFDPKIEASIGASNYFVTGDLVSRIGTHIGGTFELIVPGPKNLSAPEAVKRHFMDVVLQVVNVSGRHALPSVVLAKRSSAPRGLKILPEI